MGSGLLQRQQHRLNITGLCRRKCAFLWTVYKFVEKKKILQHRRILLQSSSPREGKCVPSLFFSANLKVLSQGNLSESSLQGPGSATTD